MSAPFDDLRRALSDISQPEATETGARLDFGRLFRTGVPEIIFGGAKSTEEVISSLRRLAEQSGRGIASRCSALTLQQIYSELGSDYLVELHQVAGGAVVARPGCSVHQTGGVVGILAAGTSDARVVAEASMIAREMGAGVLQALDVGVAGIHRLVRPLEEFTSGGADVLVVCAGMDGVLPSVVSGLVSLPIIGLPVSTGYGFGGHGIGALTTMLQSCSPGVVVVNIDNGIGAGAAAALIANRVAAARQNQNS